MTHEAAGDIQGVFKYCEPIFIPKNPQKLCYSLFILQLTTTLETAIFTLGYLKFGGNTTGNSQVTFSEMSQPEVKSVEIKKTSLKNFSTFLNPALQPM